MIARRWTSHTLHLCCGMNRLVGHVSHKFVVLSIRAGDGGWNSLSNKLLLGICVCHGSHPISAIGLADRVCMPRPIRRLPEAEGTLCCREKLVGTTVPFVIVCRTRLLLALSRVYAFEGHISGAHRCRSLPPGPCCSAAVRRVYNVVSSGAGDSGGRVCVFDCLCSASGRGSAPQRWAVSWRIESNGA